MNSIIDTDSKQKPHKNLCENSARQYLGTIIFVFIISVLIVSCTGQTQAEQNTISGNSTLKNTRFTVQGEFLHFFNIYGGAESLGNPLSEQIVVDGWNVQYFENGRLEYHPENGPAYKITVGWLGDLLNRRQPPIPAANIPGKNTKNRRYYSETGHTVSGDFLYYFDIHGGSVRFGLPISEPFLNEGILTQDFQSARFYWIPQAEEPVTLEDIGRVHLEIVSLQTKK
jgi:hypothetical protein